MTNPIPLEPGKFYHIYNRGNNGENIFIAERNYAYFLNLYAKHIEPVAETFGYCLLRNHFHVLARIRPERPGRFPADHQSLLTTSKAGQIGRPDHLVASQNLPGLHSLASLLEPLQRLHQVDQQSLRAHRQSFRETLPPH